MSQRRRKEALALLEARNLDAIVKWAMDHRGALRTLNSLTYNKDKLVEWRAIEAIGKVAAKKGESDVPWARDLIRRQLWTMTEESGGTAWHAPEIIGAVLANVPELIPEFGRLLAPLFHEEPFERGACWAVWRAAQVNPEPFEAITDEVVALITGSDPYMRFFAVEALRAMGKQDLIDAEALRSAAASDERLVIYDFDSGELKETELVLPAQ